MNVDKFGSYVSLKNNYNVSKLHECRCMLKYTNDGNIDLQNKLIKNVGTPIKSSDCATKKYVDDTVDTCHIVFKNLDKIIADVIDKVNKLERHTIDVVRPIKKK